MARAYPRSRFVGLAETLAPLALVAFVGLTPRLANAQAGRNAEDHATSNLRADTITRDDAATFFDLKAYAESPPGRLAKRVSIPDGPQPVETIVRLICARADLSLAFESGMFAGLPTISPVIVNQSAADALLSVLEGTRLKAVVSRDWRIIITRADAPLEVTSTPKTQTIRGVVVDRHTQVPLQGATVVVLGTDPLLGSSTNHAGKFEIRFVPTGRHNIEARYLGYETLRQSGVLVGSAKEVSLRFELTERVLTGETIVVVPQLQKDRPINEMAAVSVRGFTVEETRRYAGGVDDPARMASAFAGVTTTGDIGDNALIVRGNAPKGVLWRLEGVEIPNPNHFAGLNVAGGGGVTVFSSQMLDDSDFLTGAFPAEYGNALAGVFDMHLRRGNASRREHTIQLGLLGLDLASEGPFGSASDASYLFNYRYSTLGLLMPLLPINDVTTYQDLSYKLSFPLAAGGRLDLWGIGGIDGQRQHELEDPADWQYTNDRTRLRLALAMGATGVTYRRVVGRRAYVTASGAVTGQRTSVREWYAQDDQTVDPSLRIRNTSRQAILAATLNSKLSRRVLNRSGLAAHFLSYDLDVAASPNPGAAILVASRGNGQSTLLRAFSQTRVELGTRLVLDGGLHVQRFGLSGDTSVEPRAAVRYEFDQRSAFTAGYGLHSQVEDLRIYLARTGESASDQANRDLDMTKAHHAVVGFETRVGSVARIRLEGYYQYLFDVPVIPDSTYSLANFEQDFEFSSPLSNDGAGRNYGIELTVERFLQGGYYFLVTGSAFKSTYRAGDGVWRDSRFDRTFAANALAGREFILASSGSVFGVNARVTFNGGHRHSPVDQNASAASREVVFDDSRIFAERTPATAVVDVTVTYRKNRRRFSSVWAMQVKNMLAAGVPYHDYDYMTGRVEELRDRVVLPVLSYKIEF